MPACIYCQHLNPEGTRMCTACNARLPALGFSSTTPSMDLQVNAQLATLPRQRYHNDLMIDLSWAAYDHLREGADVAVFEECFQEVLERFERFETTYGQLQTSLQEEARNSDSQAHQILFLCARAKELYESGIDQVCHCLENDETYDLMDGVRLLMDASDYATHALKLLNS